MSAEKAPTPNALLAPPGAYDHPSSTEILRAWVTGNGLEVSLRSFWSDRPENWGILLVDLARHAARIYQDEDVCGFDKALASIKSAFEAEWEEPTDIGSTRPDLRH